MGTYINPGNIGFAEINDEHYVDKTLLIELVNQSIDTPKKLTCVSRPRRFGKSFAARMLSAYYDCSCDSHTLFDDKKIAGTPDYEKHLNQYNIVYLDITGFISEAKRKNETLRGVPDMIVEAIRDEVVALVPELAREKTLNDVLLRFTEQRRGKKLLFIIDEWDSMIREAKDDVIAQQAYLNLLRGWFKNANFTPKAVAAAYMTGILPIKKDGSQSAISDFKEFSMIKPRQYGEFVGFTESEVKDLCKCHGSNFAAVKKWYDGYAFKDVGSVYNPNSVIVDI